MPRPEAATLSSGERTIVPVALSGPVLTESDITYLLEVPKLVDDPDWRSALLPMRTEDYGLRARLDLPDLPSTGPVRGRLLVYTRQNLNPNVGGDWSTGFIYTSYADDRYPVIRCNGPHPSDHTNRIERNKIVRTPHVHRLTERYQRLRPPKSDGFAEETTVYVTIEEALEHLAETINLQVIGALFR